MAIVNVPLLKNPLNWLTVGFMLLLAAMLGVLTMHAVGIHPAVSNQ